MSIVSHSSLTPLHFLERSAEVFPTRWRSSMVTGAPGVPRFRLRGHPRCPCPAGVGDRPGDRVAYLCPNIPELLIAHFAVPLAGAVLVAINTRLAPEEVRYICDHSGAKLLVVDSELRSIIDPLADRFETIGEIVTVIDPMVERGASEASDDPRYSDLLERGSDEPLQWTVEDELATITINYTSGTTGKTQGSHVHRTGAPI